MSRGIGKVYEDRVRRRWYIQLPGKVRLFVDRDGTKFYSQQHAEDTLNDIRARMHPDHYTFNPDDYRQKKESIRLFAIYADEWLQGYEDDARQGLVSPGYLESIRTYKKLFVNYFGKMDLLEIHGLHLDKFRRTLTQYSPKSIENIMGALHRLFTKARRHGIIQLLPEFPEKIPVPEYQPKWATVEVQDAILSALSPDAYYFVLFQMCHGTRNGETRALQHGDIDLENNTVTIRRAFSNNKLRPFPKNRRPRTIPLDSAWANLYSSRERSFPANFVFTGRDGQPLGKQWGTRQWNAACAKVGVHGISLYEGTRHSLASQAVSRGVPILTVSKFLGHSKIETTMKYARLNVEPLRQVQRQGNVVEMKKRGEG